MINLFLKLILGLISTIINFFLTPIFTLIENIYNTLKLDQFIGYITTFFNNIRAYVNFVISYTGFNDTIVGIVCLLLIGIISVPIIVSGYKLVAKWISILP